MVASEYASIDQGVSDLAFLQSLAKALIALLLSALILIPVFLLLHSHSTQPNVQAKIITGNELSVILGEAAKSSTSLQLSELSESGRAIFSKKINFKASDFPFVSYQIANRHPGTNIYLIWRTADKPEEMHNTRLYWSGDKPTSINMAKFERWHGNITELGLDVYGDLRDKPLTIESLTLAPYSWPGVVSTIWSEWSTFHGWDQTSINHLRGTPSNPLLSPTVAAAAWVGLALLILAIPYLFTNTLDVIAYGAIILIPWVLLDLLWQGELNTQLEETGYLFAGKTQYEKHLAEKDGDLYAYVQHLKAKIAFAPEARIFLLHNSRGHNFTRLRAQFHLLPLNVYNYGRYPQTRLTRPGDYILLIGDTPGLEYNSQLGILKWGKNKTLPAAQVDKRSIGALYQLPVNEGSSGYD